ncbi:hypothetical protein EDD86DRAFT_199982 [Gorgonomyces haynaldii]|nr:hypothetical protein EDD86DRAFT_199982 [Gorgonomyces haynaldii]
MKHASLLLRARRALGTAAEKRISQEGIRITFGDGTMSNFHPFWLRDHCKCPQCWHQVTKQRLVDTVQIPDDIAVKSMHTVNGTVQIEWDGGHKSTFDLDWLKHHAYSPPTKEEPKTIHLWGRDLAQSLPETPYDAVMSGDDGLKQWLLNIEKYGIGLVTGIPTDSIQHTGRVAERIARIRETHYGSLWEFTADLAHGDTAYTNLALPAHTDTTYFTDPIGLQFFHVIEHNGTGGESLYVDGFNVALQLKEKSPWAYNVLTRTLLSAHSAGDKETLIQPAQPFPIIGLNAFGHLHQIRFNNDDRTKIFCRDQEQMLEFYQALKEWTLLLRKPENELWMKLKPGTAVMVDNWRTLHGRSAFTGKRRVVGSYHGHDDYMSRLKTLCYPDRRNKL